MLPEWSPSLFRCLVCGDRMSVADGKPPRIECPSRHSYDISRQGTLNFLTHPVTDYYASGLFTARREVWDSGLFAPISDKLANLLYGLGERITILDAGCGEGTPLAHTVRSLKEAGCTVRPVGIDIAKDAIKMAARQWNDMLWVTGDLTHLPFTDSSFDAVINLLSPASYEEFSRVTKTDGTIVKVIPENGYLRELRSLLPSETEPTPRGQVTKRFFDAYPNGTAERLCYSARIPDEKKAQLVRMTPLCAHFSESECIGLAEKLEDSITVDVTFLLGQV